MRTVTAYNNGATMGAGNPDPSGGPRGAVLGWSPSSVRRHKRWLYSVDALSLSGVGTAVTLTLRDCPPSHQDWQYVLQLLMQWLRDNGAIRWHWVVEWQRRGVPHLHMAAYGPRDMGPDIEAAWVRITSLYGSDHRGQVSKPITGPMGWLKYLSKHASRSVKHYQRQGMPSGWSKTGRLWGYGGDWPTELPIKAEVTPQTFWKIRRAVQKWARADAVSRGDNRSAAYLKRSRACSDRSLSEVRGISEWVPQDVMLELLARRLGWNTQRLTVRGMCDPLEVGNLRPCRGHPIRHNGRGGAG